MLQIFCITKATHKSRLSDGDALYCFTACNLRNNAKCHLQMYLLKCTYGMDENIGA